MFKIFPVVTICTYTYSNKVLFIAYCYYECVYCHCYCDVVMAFDKVGIMLYIDHIWTNCNDYSMYMYIYNYTYQITMIDNITVSGSS